MDIQPRTQKFILWWVFVFAVIYAVVGFTLLPMIPPLPPEWSAEQVAAWYQEHATRVTTGALICGWVAAWWLPLFVIVAQQVRRHEMLQNKLPIWSAIIAVAGGLTSISLVFPPIFWGVCAWTPTRAPEITLMMHQLATLTMVATNQFYIFGWVGICIVCFTPTAVPVPHTPFTRNFGYFMIWGTLLEELSALAWLSKSGILSWNGLFPWWIPLITIFIVLPGVIIVMMRAINAQASEVPAGGRLAPAVR
jgi:hypothetical protein